MESKIENNIIYRPEISNKYDDMPSFGHVMLKNLTEAGERIVLVDGLTGEKLSAVKLLGKSVELAKGLLAAGLQQGDVVSIISENRIESAFIIIGTILNNCIVAPINNTYSEREIIHALNLSKPKILFVSKALSAKVIDIAKSLSFIQKIVLLDNEASTDSKTLPLSEFVCPKRLVNIRYEPKAVNTAETCCFILCSSGTTGLPKGVMLSQSSMIIFTRYFEDAMLSDANCGTGERVLLGLLPLFHGYGIGTFTSTLAAGCGKIVLLPKFEGLSFLKTIQDHRVTVAFLVPPLMVFLAKHPVVDKFDISSLRQIFYGAAPLSKETEQAVKDRLKNPQLGIKQGYGMTELTIVITNQANIIKQGSIGELNAGAYGKVIDENGKALGPNQQGELCFKGERWLMMGYINDKAATDAMIDKDGWLHTGDVGYYDEDLQFYIVDRIKELIKWKGFQVPPAEIEALLLTHKNIRDCGVIGIPDESAGELAVAFVVRDDSGISEADVIKFVADNSSPAKRLHGGVIFVDEIPKNPSGKILRRVLREWYKQRELKPKL